MTKETRGEEIRRLVFQINQSKDGATYRWVGTAGKRFKGED